MNITKGNKYSKEWFKKRAVNSIRRISDGMWDFSDSLLLYMGSGSDTYEQLQEEESAYFNLVTKPERDYLEMIAGGVASLLPDEFEYIDLGPGTEHKEQFFFDAFNEQDKIFTYIPVDISDQFLDAVAHRTLSKGIPVIRTKASFEELPDVLGESKGLPRFVSLGLTFSNYEPKEILTLLVKIAGEGGYVFINAQIRDRVNMQRLQEVYQADAVDLVNEKVKLLGLDPFQDISPRIADDGFRVWCTVFKSNPLLESIGVKSGDKMMVFQSLRYTEESLKDVLSGFDCLPFDIGKSFVGTVIRA